MISQIGVPCMSFKSPLYLRRFFGLTAENNAENELDDFANRCAVHVFSNPLYVCGGSSD